MRSKASLNPFPVAVGVMMDEMSPPLRVTVNPLPWSRVRESESIRSSTITGP